MKKILLICLTMFAMLVCDAQAAIMHISKSYAAGYTKTSGPGAYEFNASSPVYFMEMMRDNNGVTAGFDTTLSADGFHEVIFEDSSTYNMITDCTTKWGDPGTDYATWKDTKGMNVGPVQGDFWHVTNYRKVRFRAATGQHPVIDMRNFPAGAWGVKCFFGNWNETCQAEFDGIKFIYTPGTYGGWGDGVVFTGGTGGAGPNASAMPVFKNCIFDGIGKIIAFNGNKMGDPGQAEFQQCAFRVYGPDGTSIVRISDVTPSTYYTNYQFDFENCSFINVGNPATALWDAGKGDKGEKYGFTSCLFFNFQSAVKGGAPAVWSGCLEYNADNAAGTPANSFKLNHIAGTNNCVVANPLLLDINADNFFLLTEGSPAANAGVKNIGFDKVTVPVELSNFSTE